MPRPMFISPRTGSRICSKLCRCRGIEKSVSCRPRMYMKLSGESGSPLSMCWKEMTPVGWSLTQAVSSNGTIFTGSSQVGGSGDGRPLTPRRCAPLAGLVAGEGSKFGGHQRRDDPRIAGIGDADLPGRGRGSDQLQGMVVIGAGRPYRSIGVPRLDDRDPVLVEGTCHLPQREQPTLGEFDGQLNLDLAEKAAHRAEQSVATERGELVQEMPQVLHPLVQIVELGQPLGGLAQRGDLLVGR